MNKEKVIIKKSKSKKCKESFSGKCKYRLYYDGTIRCFLCKKEAKK
jgi:hypothetical protein